jgi:hypothetical protein
LGESATEVDGRLVWGPAKTYARRTVQFIAGVFKPAAAMAGLPHGLRFHDLRLADRLQEAYADAVADPARTETSPAALPESKEAGR